MTRRNENAGLAAWWKNCWRVGVPVIGGRDGEEVKGESDDGRGRG